MNHSVPWSRHWKICQSQLKFQARLFWWMMAAQLPFLSTSATKWYASPVSLQVWLGRFARRRGRLVQWGHSQFQLVWSIWSFFCLTFQVLTSLHCQTSLRRQQFVCIRTITSHAIFHAQLKFAKLMPSQVASSCLGTSKFEPEGGTDVGDNIEAGHQLRTCCCTKCRVAWGQKLWGGHCVIHRFRLQTHHKLGGANDGSTEAGSWHHHWMLCQLCRLAK